jgi:bifunctional oligoribonuclease and PAP phosphatase NrnA
MRQLNFDSLKELATAYSNKRVMLTFHSMGDTDSVASAFALKEIFKNSTIASPDFITGNSKRILERFDFDVLSIKENFDDNADMIVLADVNNFEDCSRFKRDLENFKGKILIIDHHTPRKYEQDNIMVFNSESYNSATSIIYDLLKSMKIEIRENLANLMAAGIISDSAELRNAFPKTFVQIGELLQKGGIDYQSLLLEMRHIAPIQNRENFIKDLFNAKIILQDNLLILYGQAQIHANIIADDAIKIGSDVSIFYSVKETEVAFSVRLRPPLDKIYKINLGEIMKSLAPIIDGTGGGHPCAAGAYGQKLSKAQEFLDALLLELKKKISK